MPNWEAMWASGLGKGQAFDVGKASATLIGALSRMVAPKPGMTALVPGCGRAYDALALALHGFNAVTAIDISPTACEAARAELVAVAAQSAEAAAGAAKVTIECGDFFATNGAFDLVWDCTFLCALDPSDRERWSAKQPELLRPGGRLLTCVFPLGVRAGGPPFELSVPLIRSLLEPVGFEAVEVRENLPPEEMHQTGAMRGDSMDATIKTAFAAWQLRQD